MDEKMVVVNRAGKAMIKTLEEIKKYLGSGYQPIRTAINTHTTLKGHRIYSSISEYLLEAEERYNSVKEHLLKYGNTICTINPKGYLERLKNEGIHATAVYQEPIRGRSSREYVMRELWILERRSN